MSQEKIILGIDPGTTIMGFGLIKIVGKKMEFMQLNELMLKKYDDHYLKLKLIFERTVELIDTYHPDEIAIEAPFLERTFKACSSLVVRKVWLWRQDCRVKFPLRNIRQRR